MIIIIHGWPNLGQRIGIQMDYLWTVYPGLVAHRWLPGAGRAAHPGGADGAGRRGGGRGRGAGEAPRGGGPRAELLRLHPPLQHPGVPPDPVHAGRHRVDAGRVPAVQGRDLRRAPADVVPLRLRSHRLQRHGQQAAPRRVVGRRPQNQIILCCSIVCYTCIC